MRRGIGWLAACALAGVAMGTSSAWAQNVVISQVYGGGGCGSVGCSYYNNDFIELFNAGASDATLTNWSVQYGSASGTGNWNAATIASATIPAGGYFLIQANGNTNGQNALPTPDLVLSNNAISMSATTGKVALVKRTTQLSGANPLTDPNQAPYIADLIGYGVSPVGFEGAPTGTNLSTILSTSRKGGGCTDTNNNASDFDPPATPAARNSAWPKHYCGASSDPTGFGTGSPNPLFAGETVTLTVTVTPGANPPSTSITVTGDLSVLGGSAGQAFTETGPGTNVFTCQQPISCSFNTGTTDVTPIVSIAISDAESRSAATVVPVTVRPSTTKIGVTTSGGVPPDNGQPFNVAVCPGRTAQFSVRAEGPNLSYKWYYGEVGSGVLLSDGDRDGRVSGATASILLIADAQIADVGSYYAVVTGSCTGSMTSNAATLSLGAAASERGKQIVISQVYGGGGNGSGSTAAYWTIDFIELFNKGTTSVDVTGWSVQYASSDTAGSQPNFDSPSRYTILSGIIQPGHYYLIQESQGNGGSHVLPTPDVDGVTQAQGPILIGSEGGKVALLNNAPSLTGPCPLATCTLVDFVGWNTSSTCHEGAASAPATTNTTSVFRKSPCVDTDQNGDDFVAGAVVPHNSASPIAPAITTPPANQAVCEGLTATFTVVADGPCLSYQWQVKNGANWEDVTTGTGGNTVSYTTATITAGDDGRQYRVVVSNAYGPPATSDPAAVMIAPANDHDKQIVISQVYGGGGNTGGTPAVYKNDFIELYNKGTTPVDVTGWSVQYAGATGINWSKTDLTGVIQPGTYYLIQEAEGSGGTQSLPTPKAIGVIAMSGSAGKVALLKTGGLLSGDCPKTDCRVVDFVGYGAAATCSEGTGPAPYTTTGDNTQATVRTPASKDTDDNAADFVVATAQATHYAPGDFNGDGFVNATDYDLFEPCISGPSIPSGEGCQSKDLDGDADVDQDDFGLFQRCYNGPNPAVLTCLLGL